MKLRSLLTAAAIFSSPQVFGADIAREVFQPNDADSSFAEIGLSVVTGQVPLVGINDQTLEESGDTTMSLHIGLEGRFEYKGFFLEFIDNSFSDVTLGFDAYTTENSHHEVIVTSLFSEIERDNEMGTSSNGCYVNRPWVAWRSA